MQKISKTQAILLKKCPKCRKGDVFKYSIWNPFKVTLMYKQCPNCHVTYEQEPGFFIGAMYVSYVFSVALILMVGLGVFYFFNDPPTHIYLFTIVGSIFLAFPLIFRYARVLYLYIASDIEYEEEKV